MESRVATANPGRGMANQLSDWAFLFHARVTMGEWWTALCSLREDGFRGVSCLASVNGVLRRCRRRRASLAYAPSRPSTTKERCRVLRIDEPVTRQLAEEVVAPMISRPMVHEVASV